MNIAQHNLIQKKVNTLFYYGIVIGFTIFTLLLFPFFRNILILTTEKIFLKRKINHDFWNEYIKNISIYAIVLTIIVTVLKIFTFIFSQKCKNSFINLSRCVACLIVFILHSSIFTERNGALWNNNYIRLLKTPAWGGVWIFFILSGYLAGKSFFSSRYTFDMKEIICYYKAKFIRIVIPVFSFIFLCCVLIYPCFVKNNPIVIFKWITFSYNANPGVDGIGATWYVFTLIPLYLLSPLFSFFAGKLSKNKFFLSFVTILVIFIGFLYRFCAYNFGLNWYSMIYTPFYANIDLFFSGILICKIIDVFNCSKLLSSKLFKDIGLFVFLVFILMNTICYDKFFFYAIICPTLYLLIFGFCLIVFSDEQYTFQFDNWFEKTIDKFSSISFEFYLFHSLILNTILPAFSENNIYVLHFKILLWAFILTLIFSYGYNRIFKGVKCKI